MNFNLNKMVWTDYEHVYKAVLHVSTFLHDSARRFRDCFPLRIFILQKQDSCLAPEAFLSRLHASESWRSSHEIENCGQEV